MNRIKRGLATVGIFAMGESHFVSDYGLTASPTENLLTNRHSSGTVQYRFIETAAPFEKIVTLSRSASGSKSYSDSWIDGPKILRVANLFHFVFTKIINPKIKTRDLARSTLTREK